MNKFFYTEKILSAFGLYFLYSIFVNSLYNKFKLYNLLKNTPYVKDIIKKKIESAKEEIDKIFNLPNHQIIRSLPNSGLEISEIYNLQNKYLMMREFEPSKGQISGTIYKKYTNQYLSFMMQTYKKFMFSNPLHPDVFPDIRIMESEIINMVKKMFNGSMDVCGNVTSGGTESIILACKTYRDWARDVKNISSPEIIVGESVHASFYKACHYLNIKYIVIQNNEDKEIDCSLIEKKINCNTIALVGSAPSFAHGVMDNIEKLSELALKYKIGLHVDCCLGGFVVPFLKKTNLISTNFDFTLEGVTSISADMHKYGYSLKGSSAILYRSLELRKYQYSIYDKWNGGIYATSNMTGTRSGAIVAATWSSLLYHGYSKYEMYAKQLFELKNNIVNQSKEIDGLEIMGNPISTVVAFDSKQFDIYLVANYMSKKKWNLNILQNPQSFHICLTQNHLHREFLENFMIDLNLAVKFAKENKDNKIQGLCAIYGMAVQFNNKDAIDEIVSTYLDSLTYL